jgi:hypothetical protein
VHRRAVAVSLIVLILIGTNAAFHGGADDVCDLPVAVQGDGGGAQLSAQPTPEPAHCAICHWLQTFRAGSIGHPLLQTSALPSTSPASPAPASVVTADRFTLPLRAPPA